MSGRMFGDNAATSNTDLCGSYRRVSSMSCCRFGGHEHEADAAEPRTLIGPVAGLVAKQLGVAERQNAPAMPTTSTVRDRAPPAGCPMGSPAASRIAYRRRRIPARTSRRATAPSRAWGGGGPAWRCRQPIAARWRQIVGGAALASAAAARNTAATCRSAGKGLRFRAAHHWTIRLRPHKRYCGYLIPCISDI